MSQDAMDHNTSTGSLQSEAATPDLYRMSAADSTNGMMKDSGIQLSNLLMNDYTDTCDLNELIC